MLRRAVTLPFIRRGFSTLPPKEPLFNQNHPLWQKLNLVEFRGFFEKMKDPIFSRKVLLTGFTIGAGTTALLDDSKDFPNRCINSGLSGMIGMMAAMIAPVSISLLALSGIGHSIHRIHNRTRRSSSYYYDDD